ncbi:amidohydrolase family protein [Chungangia koreensis]|uniref:Amidohydrolase family protein n=1 Tax=Chungangia koreensis TaxID=752657 RepID=A0ABV8XA09_9LACT
MDRFFNKKLFIIVLFLSLILLIASLKITIILPKTSYVADRRIVSEIIEMRKKQTTVIDKYLDLPLIDVHNHDADTLELQERRSNDNYASLLDTWTEYGIDRTVLFGAVSDPAAVKSDRYSWSLYEKYPNRIYPAFTGVKIDKNSNSLQDVKQKLEKGIMQMGELYAASQYSPYSSVKWKAKHPNDGLLPEIYDLAAEYKVPVMLHIDPPNGFPMQQFKLTLKNHPNTLFIFAHGNVHTAPDELEELLAEHDNLLIDFFAGFTAYNPGSKYELVDFVPLVEEYRGRFVLGSDSGYSIGLENSYTAMYQFIDLLSPETAGRVAFQNYEEIIEKQPPTKEQIKRIKQLAADKNLKKKWFRLNKRTANELIFSLEKSE